MSKIVVLAGSMRRGGNTDLLVHAFAEGARKNNEVEIVSVADYKVNPCIGCNSCFTREGNTCFQNDDMPAILDKLRTTDVIVIASPVYFCGISAQLKAIIDRLHTPMKDNFPIRKAALLLIEGGTSSFEPMILQYQAILRYFHIEDVGMVLVTGVREKGEIKENEALKKAFDLGLSLR